VHSTGLQCGTSPTDVCTVHLAVDAHCNHGRGQPRNFSTNL